MLTAEDLRMALGFQLGQGDPDELDLFAQAAVERIDTYTGRDVDPDRHLLPSGELPVIFRLAARETAKLWWQQSKNGPRGVPSSEGITQFGPPMGADLPRKVEGWLAAYPPRPGFGATAVV